jgi:hypothetical protein
MQRTFFCLAFLLIQWFRASSQGFNHTYDLGQRAAVFTNLSILNDTITLIGLNYDTVPPYRSGICFAQFDTLGNIFQQSSHYTDEDFWSPLYKQGFVKLKDHKGYAIIGTHFNTQRGYLLRLDEQGNLIYLKRYPKGNFFTNYWHHILEVPGGFLVAVNKQKLDYNINVYLYRLNNSGNILWQVSLGDNKGDYVTGLTRINDNEYVVAQSASLLTSNYSENVGCTQLRGLDSLGTLKWFWESPLAFDELGATGLKRLVNDGKGIWLSQPAGRRFPGHETIPRRWIRRHRFFI